MWWTDRLLPVLNADDTTRQLVWVLVWRNAYHENREGHFYAPSPGHPSAENLVQFRDNPLLLFEEDLPELYERP